MSDGASGEDGNVVGLEFAHEHSDGRVQLLADCLCVCEDLLYRTRAGQASLTVLVNQREVETVLESVEDVDDGIAALVGLEIVEIVDKRADVAGLAEAVGV